MDEPCCVDDEMRPEYDFSGGVRGKYAERYARRFGVEIVPAGTASSACAQNWTSPVRAIRPKKRE